MLHTTSPSLSLRGFQDGSKVNKFPDQQLLALSSPLKLINWRDVRLVWHLQGQTVLTTAPLWLDYLSHMEPGSLSSLSSWSWRGGRRWRTEGGRPHWPHLHHNTRHHNQDQTRGACLGPLSHLSDLTIKTTSSRPQLGFVPFLDNLLQIELYNWLI